MAPTGSLRWSGCDKFEARPKKMGPDGQQFKVGKAGRVGPWKNPDPAVEVDEENGVWCAACGPAACGSRGGKKADDAEERTERKITPGSRLLKAPRGEIGVRARLSITLFLFGSAGVQEWPGCVLWTNGRKKRTRVRQLEDGSSHRCGCCLGRSGAAHAHACYISVSVGKLARMYTSTTRTRDSVSSVIRRHERANGKPRASRRV